MYKKVYTKYKNNVHRISNKIMYFLYENIRSYKIHINNIVNFYKNIYTKIHMK